MSAKLRRPVASLVLLGLVAWLSAPLTSHSWTVPRPVYGEPYRVLDSAAEAPQVVGANLVVRVNYGGGCSRHSFAPVYSGQSMVGPIVWLTHSVDRPERCTTPTAATVSIPLTDEIRSAHRVTLFAPGAPNRELAVP